MLKGRRCEGCGKFNRNFKDSVEFCTTCNKRDYCVYVFRIQDFVKIGYSGAWQNRLRQLQISSPFAIDLLLKVPCPTLLIARELEIVMHISAVPWRVHGEWFKYNLELMERLKAIQIMKQD